MWSTLLHHSAMCSLGLWVAPKNLFHLFMGWSYLRISSSIISNTSDHKVFSCTLTLMALIHSLANINLAYTHLAGEVAGVSPSNSSTQNLSCSNLHRRNWTWVQLFLSISPKLHPGFLAHLTTGVLSLLGDGGGLAFPAGSGPKVFVKFLSSS